MRDSVGAVLKAQVMMRQIVRWNEQTFLIPAFVLKMDTQTEQP
jgi:hypothetical protein